MLRILAIVGDAEASAHLRSSVAAASQLQFICDARGLGEQAKHGRPDVIVVGSGEATNLNVRVTVRCILERSPATRVLGISRLDAGIRPLVQAHSLDLSDVIILRVDTAGMTRDLLFKVDQGRTADLIVRRRVCVAAPKWLQPCIEWYATDPRPTRLTVHALAQVLQMRRETLARKLKACGICSPNELSAWILLLRVVARMPDHGPSLASIARDLGLPSSASLANLFVRWTGETATEARAQGFDHFAKRALRAIFGSRRAPAHTPALQSALHRRGPRAAR
jgi:AraC-like DNA-binding protein